MLENEKPATGRSSPRHRARMHVYNTVWHAAKTKGVSTDERTKACRDAVAEFDRLNPVNANAEDFTNPPRLAGHEAQRIQWSHEEIKKVAINLAAKLRTEAKLRHVPDKSDRVGGSLAMDYLRIAQSEVLPRERRRTGPTIARSQFSDRFWQEVEIALTAHTEPAPPIVEPEKKPVAAIVEAPPPAEEKLSEVPLAKLLTHTFSALLEFIGKSEAQGQQLADLSQWKEAFLGEMNELHQEVGKLRAAVANGSHVAPEPPKKVLPRVAIVACQRYMFDHITRGAEARGIKCEWHHYDQSENPKKVHADWAISLRWGGHAWDDQLKISIPNPDRRVFLSGGTSEAIKQLEAWFALPS